MRIISVDDCNLFFFCLLKTSKLPKTVDPEINIILAEVAVY